MWNGNKFDASPSQVTQEIIRNEGLRLYGPSWRWETANRIVRDGTARHHEKLGAVIWQTVDHLRPVPERFRSSLLGDRAMDVAGAQAIYDNRLMRLEVEAQILAGLSCSQVAERSGLKTESVRDYHDIFFDMQVDQSHPGWIMDQIAELDKESPDYLRRCLYRNAFRGGPVVCEYWLGFLHILGQDHDLSTATGRGAERLELLVLSEQACDQGYPSTPRLADYMFEVANAKAPLPVTIGEMVTQKVSRVLQDYFATEAVESKPLPVADKDLSQDVA